jgi:Fe-S oxidoreductase
MFGEMKDYLVAWGVRSVLVACPSCYKVFAQYGDRLTVRSIYEVLADDERAGRRGLAATVTVHDPCAVRFAEPVLVAVRKLIGRQGLTVEEMAHSRRTTLCCGSDSAVGCLSRGLAEEWGRLRREEAAGRSVVTYCAGCANALPRLAPTTHVLDLLFEPEAALSGGVKVTKPPFTYWKRLRLKKWFKEHVPVAVARERTFTAGMARAIRCSSVVGRKE